MAVQVPVLVVTSGVRELARLTAVLGRLVGVGATRATRAAGRTVGKSLKEFGRNIAREARAELGTTGFQGMRRFIISPAVKFSDKQRGDTFWRVVNWLIPDELFQMFGVAEDPEAAGKEFVRKGIIIKERVRERTRRLRAGEGLGEIAADQFRREFHSQLADVQDSLEGEIANWIFANPSYRI